MSQARFRLGSPLLTFGLVIVMTGGAAFAAARIGSPEIIDRSIQPLDLKFRITTFSASSAASMPISSQEFAGYLSDTDQLDDLCGRTAMVAATVNVRNTGERASEVQIRARLGETVLEPLYGSTLAPGATEIITATWAAPVPNLRIDPATLSVELKAQSEGGSDTSLAVFGGSLAGWCPDWAGYPVKRGAG